jgi:flagellar motor switch protein FliM
MVRVVLNDLSSAFEPITPVNFSFERLEIDPKFATIARPSNAVIVAKFRIEMEERGGLLDVLIPYATLEPVRELLLQMFMGEKFGRDAIWETHLANELWKTEVELTAVLDEQTIALGKIFNLKKGSSLPLDVKSTSLVDIKCGNIKMFKGVMGRKAQNIAIKIEKKLNQEKN